MKWSDRLDQAVTRVQNPCLLGVDPHLDLLPEEFAIARDLQAPRADRALAMERFCKELIELAVDRVAVVKPQSAFFEVLGADGVRAWESVVAHARAAGLLVIGDVKRSDIASTAAAYATAFLGGSAGTERASMCDAITVNPYLGPDSIEPFLDPCRRSDGGLFLLVRTSNPGGGEFQLHGTPSVCEKVAATVDAWSEEFLGECGMSSIGAVVGATHPAELQHFRELMPRAPLLLPGYGAQGATAKDVVDAFPDPRNPWRGALINSSRGIAFAWRKPVNRGRHWKDAARDALDEMIADVQGALRPK
jgi:orotidine-5'-phosphate decarboxylase